MSQAYVVAQMRYEAHMSEITLHRENFAALISFFPGHGGLLVLGLLPSGVEC